MTNVFLRSTRRQPVRTAFLLVVTALITFAFVARGAEYLVVKQETERLAGYYRSIGAVPAISGELYKDAREAAAYLESNPLVKSVNTYNYVPTVMENDFCNVNMEPYRSYATSYFAFYGTLASWSQREFEFLSDTVIEGYPEWIEAGRKVVLSRTKGINPYLPSAEPSQYYVNTLKTGDPENLDAAFENLEIGQRYLVVARYNHQEVPIMCRVEYDDEDDVFITHAIYSHPLADSFFYPVPEGEADWSDPQLSEIRGHLDRIHADQHSLNVVPLQDMSALPLTRDTQGGIYLTEGRWLDLQDNEQENRVCVIGNTFAASRRLKLGDTLTLKLQDAPSYFGLPKDQSWDAESLDSVTDTYEIVGIYDYLDTYRTIYVSNDGPNTDVQSFVYVPEFALPEHFQLDYGDPEYYDEITTIDPWNTVGSYCMKFKGTASTLPYPGSVSFELVSPEVEGEFLKEAEPLLSELGFKPELLESGWVSFQSAAQPMRESSFYNVVVFSAVLLAALGLAVFIYFFSRRREMQIVRDLGLPALCAARQAAAPLVLLGFTAVLTGAGAGWWYARGSAETLLSALPAVGEVQASAELPVWWLVLLCGIPLALVTVLAVGGAAYMAGRPLLLGQPGAKRKQAAKSAKAVPSAAVPAVAAVPAASAVPTQKAVEKGRSLNVRFVLRFVWRHMVRSWGKSLLSAGLAMMFTVSLVAIQLSIAGNREEVDRLYERTSVRLELVKANASQSTQAGGFLFEDTLQTILNTGFIIDSHVEGANYCSVFLYDEDWKPGQAVSVRDQQQTSRTIRSIDNEEKFLSDSGSGQYAEMHYAGGWDGGLFAEEWDASSGAAFPIVLPESTWGEYGLEGGELMGVACKGVFRMCEVAGYYTGDIVGAYGGLVRDDYNESEPILMPTSALRTMVPNMLYSKAVFTVDPARNQELDALRAGIDELANTPRIGGVPVRIVLWDEELRMAVEPVEASIRLMQVLYPVTLILSLLVSGGLSALLVVLSAKEAAMMRAQGTTRGRTTMMLVLQQMLTGAIGLVIGLTGVLLYMKGTRPDLFQSIAPGAVFCAALYLAAGTTGAAVSCAVVTSKNPLEMLQVKE